MKPWEKRIKWIKVWRFTSLVCLFLSGTAVVNGLISWFDWYNLIWGIALSYLNIRFIYLLTKDIIEIEDRVKKGDVIKYAIFYEEKDQKPYHVCCVLEEKIGGELVCRLWAKKKTKEEAFSILTEIILNLERWGFTMVEFKHTQPKMSELVSCK